MRYVLNEARMFADISDGMAIIINSVTGIYYGMNGFGTSVFENRLAGSSKEDVAAAAKAIPGAPAEIEANLDAFLKTIEDFGIVLTTPEETSRPAVLNVRDAKADSFVPECNEYKDVQELLFADPIHEVDAEQGWKPE